MGNVGKGIGQRAETATGEAVASIVTKRIRSKSGLASCLLLALIFGTAQARQSAGLGDPVALAQLPAEARLTEQRIHSGGPFPYAKDGVVFGNRERRLAARPRGYYHEYTVPSPGARDRGARRIVCGGTKPTEPDACFYTEDHYKSFHLIVK